MRYVEITLDGTGSKLVTDKKEAIDVLNELFDEEITMVGDSYMFECIEMNIEDFRSLDEFQGF